MLYNFLVFTIMLHKGKGSLETSMICIIHDLKLFCGSGKRLF